MESGKLLRKSKISLSLRESGFADGRRETSPDSEQIEHTVAKPQMRNSGSVEQIQDREEFLSDEGA